MHAPHTKSMYADLWTTAFESRQVVTFGGVHGGMIGALHGASGAGEAVELTGEFYRFLKIDPSDPWFNSQTKEAASENDIQAINIPGHLLPRLQRVPFLFRMSNHKLYYASADRKSSLPPRYAKRILDHVFLPLVLEGRFPLVEVTVEPASEALDEMLGLASLEHLVIELVQPNPDDAEEIERGWEERLRKQNVRKQTVSLDSERNQSIVPDKDTISLARVAASNGSVVAIGRDATGVKRELSTLNKPLKQLVQVNERVEGVMDVLRRTADNLN